jgi:hypothetical protein
MNPDNGLVTPPIRNVNTPTAREKVPYRNKTWGEAEGLKETSVLLERLPSELRFPEDFPEPITYDAVRKQLKYRGLMFSGSYAYLRKLSNDPAYLTALDQLFIGTSTTNAPGGRWTLAIVAVVTAALAVFGAWWYLRP